jgi:hypothetical protein
MSFSHVRGAVGSGTSVTSFNIVLGGAPALNDLVCVGMTMNPGQTVSGVKDSNNNSYVITPNSPFSNSVGVAYLAYLRRAPANASATITVSCSSNSGTAEAWADEFSTGSEQAIFDKDIGAGSTVANTTIGTPSITPTFANSLLFAAAFAGGTISAPTSGGTLGVWTGSGGAITGGDMSEYDLSASTATAVQFTQSSGGWACMAMSFFLQAIPGWPIPTAGPSYAI